MVGRPRGPASRPARRDAKRPFGLSLTMRSRRSILATKPLASKASRSSLSFSPGRSGTRDNAQRNVGGMAEVVSTAIVTIIV